MSVLLVKTTNELTALQGTATPGDTYFNSNTKEIRVWDGTNWRGYTNDGFYPTYSSNSSSAYFDGVDDYITVPQSSYLNISGSMSISFWFQRARAGHSAFEGIINKNEATATSVNYSIGFRPSSGDPTPNKLAFWDGDGGNLVTTSEFTNIDAKVHACFVNDGGIWSWYINGDPDSTGTGCNVTSTESDLVLGAFNAASPSLYYKGNLDEVFIWSRAITSDEVSNIYNNKTYFTKSLAAGWRLENNANDSINANNGANNGATLNSEALY